eukprot:m51a1_g13179 hypothetical protein (1666) ;mRNA; f:101569-113857
MGTPPRAFLALLACVLAGAGAARGSLVATTTAVRAVAAVDWSSDPRAAHYVLCPAVWRPVALPWGPAGPASVAHGQLRSAAGLWVRALGQEAAATSVDVASFGACPPWLLVGPAGPCSAFRFGDVAWVALGSGGLVVVVAYPRGAPANTTASVSAATSAPWPPVEIDASGFSAGLPIAFRVVFSDPGNETGTGGPACDPGAVCPRVCGDGLCAPPETCASCPSDCHAQASPWCLCGDGTCLLCPADCGPCCGNGVCDFPEELRLRSCAPDCLASCNDSVCSPGLGEDCVTCPRDCPGPCGRCGDGACDGNETEALRLSLEKVSVVNATMPYYFPHALVEVTNADLAVHSCTFQQLVFDSVLALTGATSVTNPNYYARANISHCVFKGLSTTRGAVAPTSTTMSVWDVSFEDCSVASYSYGAAIRGFDAGLALDNVQLRRCVASDDDSFSGRGGAIAVQGFYSSAESAWWRDVAFGPRPVVVEMNRAARGASFACSSARMTGLPNLVLLSTGDASMQYTDFAWGSPCVCDNQTCAEAFTTVPTAQCPLCSASAVGNLYVNASAPQTEELCSMVQPCATLERALYVASLMAFRRKVVHLSAGVFRHVEGRQWLEQGSVIEVVGSGATRTFLTNELEPFGSMTRASVCYPDEPGGYALRALTVLMYPALQSGPLVSTIDCTFEATDVAVQTVCPEATGGCSSGAWYDSWLATITSTVVLPDSVFRNVRVASDPSTLASVRLVQMTHTGPAEPSRSRIVFDRLDARNLSVLAYMPLAYCRRCDVAIESSAFYAVSAGRILHAEGDHYDIEDPHAVSQITIADTVFDTVASTSGSAIFLDGKAQGDLRNVTFSRCTAPYSRGPALGLQNAGAVLTGVLFSRCSCPGGFGGAISHVSSFSVPNVSSLLAHRTLVFGPGVRAEDCSALYGSFLACSLAPVSGIAGVNLTNLGVESNVVYDPEGQCLCDGASCAATNLTVNEADLLVSRVAPVGPFSACVDNVVEVSLSNVVSIQALVDPSGSVPEKTQDNNLVRVHADLLEMPCSNDGTVYPGTCSCACPAGWLGSQCSVAAVCANCSTSSGVCIDNDCRLCPPCVNGVCSSTTGSCTCTGNYGGALCDSCRLGFFGASCDPLEAATEVVPEYGPDSGGTAVHVFVYNIANTSSVQCFWDGSLATPGTLAAAGRQVVCSTPAHTPGRVAVSVLIDGSRWAYVDGELAFYFTGTCPPEACVNGSCAFGRCVCSRGYAGDRCDVAVFAPTISPIAASTVVTEGSAYAHTFVITGGESLPLSVSLDEYPRGVGVRWDSTTFTISWPSVRARYQPWRFTISAFNAEGAASAVWFVIGAPSYSAVITAVSPAGAVLPAGQTVLLSGYAQSLSTGSRMGNVRVDVWLALQGNSQLASLTTAGDGSFTATVATPAFAAGNVTCGARHPADEANWEPQLSFVTEAIWLSPSPASVAVYPEPTVISDFFRLGNYGDLPVRAVSARVVGAAPALNVSVLSSFSLGPLEAVPVAMSVSGATVLATYSFELVFESVEGPGRASASVTLRVRDYSPRISVAPPSLAATLVRGSFYTFSFVVANEGAQETHDLAVTLPDGSPFVLASPGLIASLGPGQRSTVVFNARVASDAPLGIGSGQIAVQSDRSSAVFVTSTPSSPTATRLWPAPSWPSRTA